MLEIACTRIANPAGRKIVEDLSERVVSMARSHEQLSLARVERDISLEAFFRRLLPRLPVPIE